MRETKPARAQQKAGSSRGISKPCGALLPTRYRRLPRDTQWFTVLGRTYPGAERGKADVPRESRARPPLGEGARVPAGLPPCLGGALLKLEHRKHFR